MPAGLGLGEADVLEDGETLALGLTEGLSELLGETLALGLTLALAELDGETLAEGETLGLSDEDGLMLDDGLTEADAEDDGLTLGLAELDGLVLALGLDEGPSRLRTMSDWKANERSGWSRRGFGIATVAILAAMMGCDVEAEGDDDGLTLAETDDEGLCEAEDDALGLLTVSRMAKCAMARSSLVPEDIPTAREPCPAVVSRTPTNPEAPMSILFSAVELAPLVGSV